MNEAGHRRTLPEQSSGSGHTFDTTRHTSVINTIQSKRVCFYKSGDPQFNGLRMVINKRTFKTFDALLDSLSKKVPLPFGVRNITTPRGVHGISTLEELEDGKSYLCSDSHKVKPFNLALAQRKLPPWYHARPVSSRRRTAQQTWFFSGRKNIHKQKPILVHTPKRLVVFRNGDPSVNHAVVLHKKTTPTYESILNYLSDLMQFHVNKLHTPDGRRVDGLPGLILCSGTVVAVGREPFRPATYRIQKSPAPKWRHPNQKRLRGQKTLKSKKKSSLNSSRSRNFSASSERHIVHQIHNSIAESSCDLPSNLSNSVESDTNCILESVAGFEGDAGDGAEGQDSFLPNDDNIEKSFRVNQDGSMTVEMKVRLTVKEEETVQWTTTLTRSVVSDQLNVACLPESEAEQEIHSNKSNPCNTAVERIHKHRAEDDNNPPCPSNETLSDNYHEEDNSHHTDVLPPWRAPTPGCKQINKQQASIESIKRVTMDGIEKGKVVSYTYGQKTENRIEQSCRPVPKPRRLGSVDVKSGDFSAFQSSKMTELMQSESSGEEVTETVLHIYEQQTCQDNFLANVCAHDPSASGAAFQPVASETGQFFELCGPSTTSKSVSMWKASLETDAVQRKESKNPAHGHVNAHQKQVTSVPSKSVDKHVRLVVTPRKRQKKNSKKRSEKLKRIKPFSSALFIKRIYGNKSSSTKKLKNLKKKPVQHRDKGMTMKSLPVKSNTKDSKLSTSLKTSSDFSQTRGTLTRQTSVRHDNKKENESSDKNTLLPPFNSSSSVTKDYVENWLEKSNLNPESNADKEHQTSEAFTLLQKDGERCGERKEVTPETCLRAPSVKLRVRSYENKSGPSVEKTATGRTNATKPENWDGLYQQNTPVKPLWNGICTETLPPSDETLACGEFGNPEPQMDTFSMELPPPPPELLNAEYFVQNTPSMESSPLYRLSSMSSQLSDNYPLTTSPSSEKTISQSYKTEKPSARLEDPSTPEEAKISQTPSIKRTVLVSNESLERKMSLRKSSLDKYTSGDAVPPPEGTQQPVLDPGSTSGSPASLTSEERSSTASILSSVASAVPSNSQVKESKMSEKSLKETLSPKTLMKRVKLKSSSSPERKLQNRKSVELQNTSPKLVPVNSRQPDKAVTVQKHSVPNGRFNKPKEVLRVSKSLDVGSPPVRHKAKFLSRNISVDTPSQKTQNKTSSQTAENKVEPADRDEPPTDMQRKPEPNMKPVLEKICCSIKSIRQITQNKRPSCLEKSNSLPDFSSHVASTFGSSSKALLAFLAVMTLKEGLTNRNVDELNANNVSCAEALKMIASLREIAEIEDSQKLKTSLSNLQQSASKQLLLSWKGFQELGCKSLSPTPLASELLTETSSEQDRGTEGNLIDEIIDNLDIPMKLKEELGFLSEGPKSETENEDKTSAGITGTLKSTATRDEQENTNSFPSKDAEVDVRSIIKKFTDISQTKRSNLDSSEAAEVQPDQSSEDYGGLNRTKRVPEQRSVERRRYRTTQSGNEEAHQEHQRRQQLDRVEKITEETPNRCGDVKSCSFKPDEQYMDFRQLMMQTEENDIKSDSTEKNSNISQDLDQNCAEVLDKGEESSSENETEAACKERKQQLNLSDAEVPSEKKHQRSDLYVEVNLKEQETNRNGEDLLETERAGIKREASESPVYNMGLNISTDESTGGSDAEEPSSEEETVAECKKLQVIMEDEEEQDEEPLHHHPNFEQVKKISTGLEALREETEEDQVSSEDEDHHSENPKSQTSSDENTLFENQDSFNQNSCLIMSENVEKDLSLNSDDSGNNHSSCEEHGEELKDGDERTSSSIQEELSYYEKQSGSEEEQTSPDRNRETQHSQCQEAPEQIEERNHEDAADKHLSELIRTQSVAKRVILLEKQVAEAQKVKNTPKISTIRSFPQRKTQFQSDDSPSESPTSESALCTRSAPQSSLSFSYDSSGVVTTEPEGSRVRSIREMFLAKSATDIHQRCFQSSNSSDLSELRAQTSASGGYQSQTSGEQSSGEDESSQKSIAKGFVRRTIEMLYGKKDAKTEEVHERPPSEPNQKKKEPSSIFSPFHAVRSKAMSELSYFNSTGALDAFGEATSCIAFNAQVGPGDGVPAENGLWIQNTQMRKSASDPIGINKTFTSDPQDDVLCKDLEMKTPYSLFSTKPEQEEETKTLPRKCTYFSLPHASESEVCQDDPNTLSKSSIAEGDVVESTDASEDTKTWAERNGLLPGVSDFKMKDNKVHPLVELPPDGEVVVVQPGKGQGVMNRRVPEPDVLDFLYHFCGEHCPVL